MRTGVFAAVIKDKKLLLVKKKETWILPGGKPEHGESDLECLAREVTLEEIPGTKLENIRYYNVFEGITPHKKDILQARVYFAGIKGEIKPGAEINACEWIDAKTNYNISEITSKLIASLIKDGYL